MKRIRHRLGRWLLRDEPFIGPSGLREIPGDPDHLQLMHEDEMLGQIRRCGPGILYVTPDTSASEVRQMFLRYKRGDGDSLVS
jgi:hypothetical protein